MVKDFFNQSKCSILNRYNDVYRRKKCISLFSLHYYVLLLKLYVLMGVFFKNIIGINNLHIFQFIHFIFIVS